MNPVTWLVTVYGLWCSKNGHPYRWFTYRLTSVWLQDYDRLFCDYVCVVIDKPCYMVSNGVWIVVLIKWTSIQVVYLPTHLC